jgi:hypothetical protein
MKERKEIGWSTEEERERNSTKDLQLSQEIKNKKSHMQNGVRVCIALLQV